MRRIADDEGAASTLMPRSRPRPSVLVVDDEPILRMIAASVLEDAGYDVAEAINGDEAFAMIEAEPNRFTHVFTDVDMPGSLDGIRLARLVSTLYPAIVVAVTSGNEEEDEGASEHYSRFIRKPWTPMDILKLVQNGAL
jgi:two-component system, response regulator PdtaR